MRNKNSSINYRQDAIYHQLTMSVPFHLAIRKESPKISYNKQQKECENHNLVDTKVTLYVKRHLS